MGEASTLPPLASVNHYVRCGMQPEMYEARVLRVRWYAHGSQGGRTPPYASVEPKTVRT